MIPQKLSPIGGRINANYDFTDLIQNLGYVSLYTVNHSDYHFLSRSGITSQNPTYEATVNSVSYATVLDYDFDFDVNATVIVAGATSFTEFFVERKSGGNNYFEARMRVYIYHVDSSSTETLIGSNATPSSVTMDVSGVSFALVTDVELTQTKFIRGEKLRVNVIIEGKTPEGAEANVIKVWMDGAGRGSTTGYQIDAYNNSLAAGLGYANPTNSAVHIPFLIRQG